MLGTATAAVYFGHWRRDAPFQGSLKSEFFRSLSVTYVSGRENDAGGDRRHEMTAMMSSISVVLRSSVVGVAHGRRSRGGATHSETLLELFQIALSLKYFCASLASACSSKGRDIVVMEPQSEHNYLSLFSRALLCVWPIFRHSLAGAVVPWHTFHRSEGRLTLDVLPHCLFYLTAKGAR